MKYANLGHLKVHYREDGDEWTRAGAPIHRNRPTSVGPALPYLPRDLIIRYDKRAWPCQMPRTALFNGSTREGCRSALGPP